MMERKLTVVEIILIAGTRVALRWDRSFAFQSAQQ
jgi:hypothetical protein